MKDIVVFGASGFIGGEIYEYFKNRDRLLFGTCFSADEGDLVRFDLNEPDLGTLDLNGVRYAIITSSVTSIDKCHNDSERAYEINVSGTKSLIGQLWRRGIVPIWFSSDYVFDGERGRYNEMDDKNPCNVYGEHKKKIEDFLLESTGKTDNSGVESVFSVCPKPKKYRPIKGFVHDKEFLILRLSKVYSVDLEKNSILSDTVRRLRNGESINCFRDQILSFTDVRDIPVCVELMIDRGLRGLYNLAAPESFSRFEFARMVKEKLNIEEGEVKSCNLSDIKLPFRLPKDISLDVGKLLREINFKFRSVEENLGEVRS